MPGGAVQVGEIRDRRSASRARPGTCTGRRAGRRRRSWDRRRRSSDLKLGRSSLPSSGLLNGLITAHSAMQSVVLVAAARHQQLEAAAAASQPSPGDVVAVVALLAGLEDAVAAYRVASRSARASAGSSGVGVSVGLGRAGRGGVAGFRRAWRRGGVGRRRGDGHGERRRRCRARRRRSRSVVGVRVAVRTGVGVAVGVGSAQNASLPSCQADAGELVVDERQRLAHDRRSGAAVGAGHAAAAEAAVRRPGRRRARRSDRRWRRSRCRSRRCSASVGNAPQAPWIAAEHLGAGAGRRVVERRELRGRRPPPTFSQASRGLPFRRHLRSASTQPRATESCRATSFRPLLAIDALAAHASARRAAIRPARRVDPTGAGRQPPMSSTLVIRPSRVADARNAEAERALGLARAHDLQTAENDVRGGEVETEALRSAGARTRASSGLRRNSTGTAGGSPPQASMNCLRNLAWMSSSLGSLVVQRRPAVVRQAVRSEPSGFVLHALEGVDAAGLERLQRARARAWWWLCRRSSRSPSTAFGSMQRQRRRGRRRRRRVAVGPVGTTVGVDGARRASACGSGGCARARRRRGPVGASTVTRRCPGRLRAGEGAAIVVATRALGAGALVAGLAGLDDAVAAHRAAGVERELFEVDAFRSEAHVGADLRYDRDRVDEVDATARIGAVGAAGADRHRSVRRIRSTRGLPVVPVEDALIVRPGREREAAAGEGDVPGQRRCVRARRRACA